jgi:hypothetical protein
VIQRICNGKTTSYLAVIVGDAEIAMALAEKGADIPKDTMGRQLIHWHVIMATLRSLRLICEGILTRATVAYSSSQLVCSQGHTRTAMAPCIGSDMDAKRQWWLDSSSQGMP